MDGIPPFCESPLRQESPDSQDPSAGSSAVRLTLGLWASRKRLRPRWPKLSKVADKYLPFLVASWRTGDGNAARFIHPLSTPAWQLIDWPNSNFPEWRGIWNSVLRSLPKQHRKSLTHTDHPHLYRLPTRTPIDFIFAASSPSMLFLTLDKS